jgi:hypothetical protein
MAQVVRRARDGAYLSAGRLADDLAPHHGDGGSRRALTVAALATLVLVLVLIAAIALH